MANKLTIYFSYSSLEEPVVERVKKRVIESGCDIFDPEHDILPGENWEKATQDAIMRADVAFFFLSERGVSPVREEELRFLLNRAKAFKDRVFLIPLGRSGDQIPDSLHRIRYLDLEDPDWSDQVLKTLETISRQKASSATTTASPRKQKWTLYLQRVHLENFRCFEDFTLDMGNGSATWVTMLGENAAGKTSLLRGIALGLCDEGEATALVKEVTGPMIRKGCQKAVIDITLIDPKSGELFQIKTTISTGNKPDAETIRQVTKPKENFPREDIFLCAYGPQRTRNAQVSYSQYRALDAVRSLFDYETSLQNPEVVLLRQGPEHRALLEQKLMDILMLSGDESGIRYLKEGIAVEGPWGAMPLDTLSDGFRSTSHWVLDLIGWLIHADRFIEPSDNAGIVLIDELEQHLHPKWQRYIATLLNRQFPHIQFITTTHTPLTAVSAVDLDHARIWKLEERDGKVEPLSIDPEHLRGKRADQVLTSPAFGMTTTRNVGSTDQLQRFNQLASQHHLSDEERLEYDTLARQLEEALNFGETPLERRVEKAVRRVLNDGSLSERSKALDLETKRQLRELFRGEA
ncbi:MAG: AAA family ATPase [Acidobacteriota bacterium]|nr:AAA family ATPase [Acidobacteriota bacterium]